MKRLTFALFSVLLLAASMAAQAEPVTTNITIPIPVTGEINPCNGEFVELQGDVHILAVSNTDGSGGFHSVLHNNYQGVTGTGSTTRARYVATNNYSETINTQPPYPTAVDFVSVMSLRAQGNVPNFYVMFHFKVTVNANGEIVVSYIDSRSECR